MNIYKYIARYTVAAGICLFGTTAFANTLSAVDVYQNGNSGKILLNVSQKPIVKKMNVSENEITLKLDNTDISSNLTSAANGMENISVMQDGNSTFITVAGNNISDYKIVNASDNTVIPTTNDSNSAIIISALLFVLSLGFMSSKKKQNETDDRKINTVKVSADEKTGAEKSMLDDLKTLRNRNRVSNTSSIHGNPVLRFSNSSSDSAVSVPESLKSPVLYEKKTAFLKTAVNS